MESEQQHYNDNASSDIEKSGVRYVQLEDEDEEDEEEAEEVVTSTTTTERISVRIHEEQPVIRTGIKLVIHKTRSKLRHILESLWWQLGVIVVLLIDLSAVIIDFSISKEAGQIASASVTAVVLTFITVELLLRLYAFGPRAFFTDWLNYLDIAVVLVGVAFLIYSLTAAHFVSWIRFVRAGIRLLRVGIGIYKQQKRLKVAARHMIGENKQRYMDSKFDLDLVYVTPRVIAMSVPAIKLEALYRNNINHVSRFFRERHGGHYKIFNMCAERDYCDHHHKLDNQVIRYPVMDHNVPTLAVMLEFCQYVEKWLDEDPKNVIAVHCRGGKGRTGTMVCAWLLYSGQCATGQEALELFGLKRTDRSRGKKFQGVETQSQCRYVAYFDWVVNTNYKCLPFTPQVNLRRIHLSVTPSLDQLARAHGWNRKRSAGKRLKDKLESKLSPQVLRKHNNNPKLSDRLLPADSTQNGIPEPQDSSTTAAAQCEPVQWKFRVTHTNGEELESPFVLTPEYPGSTDSEHVTFLEETCRRSMMASQTQLEAIEKSRTAEPVKLVGDTRLELIGERPGRGAKIFLYFWIHTAFMVDSTKIGGSGGMAPSEDHRERGDKIMLLDKNHVDRGRYKNCPFKKADKATIQLLYST